MTRQGHSGPSDGPWVLVTEGDEGQSRTALATVRALAEAGYRPAVTVSGDYALAAASRYCARRIPVPPATGTGYVDAVRAEVASHPYLTVMHATDDALRAFAGAGHELVDKVVLEDAGTRVGLRPPPGRVAGSHEELAAAAADVGYPVVVKPTVHHGARLARTPADLDWWNGKGGTFLVQRYVDGEFRSVAGVVWRGELRAVAHQRFLRLWPPDCGMACAAETIERDRDVEARLLALLDGFEGVFQADIAGGYLLDLNPRVYASMLLAVRAGANLPALYCDLLCGRDVPFASARPGHFFRWLDADVRHAVRRWRRREITATQAGAILRPRAGTVHALESIRDPGPLLARMRFLMAREVRGNGPENIARTA